MKHSSSTTVLELGRLDNWRQSTAQPFTYKLGNSTIRFQKPLVAALLAILLGVSFLSYLLASGGRRSYSNNDVHALREDHLHGPFARERKYNANYPLSMPTGD